MIKRGSAPFLMYLPAIVMIFLITIYPLIFSLNLSFHKWIITRPQLGQPFVGLNNYISIIQTPRFLNSLRVTFLFVVGAVALEFIVGLGIAILLRQSIPGMGILRSMIIIPMVIAPVVVGTMWRLLYDMDYGVINRLLGIVGLPSLPWIAEPQTALLSVIIVDFWEWTPFMVVLLYAGLQTLPREPFEAAKIDGASPLQEFICISLPLLKRVILIALILRIIEAFKTMDIVFIMTYGGPGTVTELISLYTYKVGFRFFTMGKAATLSFMILIILLICSIPLIRVMRRGEI